MAEHGGRSIGSDTSQGPGWWLASDGKWYPPELSPENRAKKKRKKAPAKKADAAASTEASTASSSDEATGEAAAGTADVGPTPGGASAGKATAGRATAGKASAGKAAAKAGGRGRPRASSMHAATASSPSADATSSGGDRGGTLELHFDDDAPPTDQIVARRVQAREQHLLLAGARQQAALRALSSLGLDPDVDRGGVATSTLAPPAERHEPSPAPSPEPPRPAEPARPAAAAPDPVESTTGTTDDDLLELDPAPVERVPAPHQPTKRPEPARSPMGTEVPFMEVRGSALGTDIERIGEKILIFADRVELRDRGNTVRQTIGYGDLAGVTIQKKIMGPTLLIESTSGETMTAKALRPELATGAKAMIEKHARRFVGAHDDDERAFAMADAGAPAGGGGLATATAPAAPSATPDAPAVVELREPAPAPARLPHKHVLAAMLDELHAAGVLDAREHAEKLALLDALSPD